MSNFKATYSYIFFGFCIIAIIGLLIALLVVYIGENKADTLAQDEAIYKTDFCDGNCTTAVSVKYRTTSYSCQSCRKRFSHPNTNVPTYCNLCANTMGRCAKCGKLLAMDEDY